jgi:ABC-2 type transport system ATP-binding protein
MELVIETRKLCKAFNKKQVLIDIDLNIEAGTPVGLVGPNGAGKTTLFSILCGFLMPTSGKVSVLGRKPLHPSLRNRVTILPQDARFLKAVPIKKQLATLAELQSFSRRGARSEAERVLEMVDLANAAHLAPEKLSHGMLKRISIAQSFIGDPELVLLDEPTAGLDPNTAKHIRNVIRAQSDKKTFIVSSHNLQLIEDLCKKVLILDKGRLSVEKDIDELVARTSIINVRLDDTPSEDISSVFSGIDRITLVETGEPGENRLTIHYRESSTPIEVEIVQCLSQAGVSYREITRGQSLEQKVADITRPKK